MEIIRKDRPCVEDSGEGGMKMGMSQIDSTMGRMLTLHADHLGFNSRHSFSTLSISRNDP